jgi:hypothetical protein
VEAEKDNVGRGVGRQQRTELGCEGPISARQRREGAKAYAAARACSSHEWTAWSSLSALPPRKVLPQDTLLGRVRGFTSSSSTPRARRYSLWGDARGRRRQAGQRHRVCVHVVSCGVHCDAVPSQPHLPGAAAQHAARGPAAHQGPASSPTQLTSRASGTAARSPTVAGGRPPSGPLAAPARRWGGHRSAEAGRRWARASRSQGGGGWLMLAPTRHPERNRRCGPPSPRPPTQPARMRRNLACARASPNLPPSERSLPIGKGSSRPRTLRRGAQQEKRRGEDLREECREGESRRGACRHRGADAAHRARPRGGPEGCKPGALRERPGPYLDAGTSVCWRGLCSPLASLARTLKCANPAEHVNPSRRSTASRRPATTRPPAASRRSS